jgi:putative flavoprotein involved in K+ transport
MECHRLWGGCDERICACRHRTAVRIGCPALENGRILEVSNVVWCTGYAPDYDWIDLPLRTHNGRPVHDRSIVESCPGLYFVGLLFLHSLSSALLGGVGCDAKYIVGQIVSTRSARMR